MLQFSLIAAVHNDQCSSSCTEKHWIHELAKWRETKHHFSLPVCDSTPLFENQITSNSLSLSHTCTHAHTDMHIYTTLHTSHACTHTPHAHKQFRFFFTQTQKGSNECLLNTDTQYANLWGNPLYQATRTTNKRPKMMKNENNSFIFHRF